ncbi:hypothetical protein GCM10010103_63920 [Streptomyces paradoxus]
MGLGAEWPHRAGCIFNMGKYRQADGGETSPSRLGGEVAGETLRDGRCFRSSGRLPEYFFDAGQEELLECGYSLFGDWNAVQPSLCGVSKLSSNFFSDS